MFQLNCNHHHHTDCNLHNHPHQVFFNELMREFDPKDPANKNRTFDKMVAAANRKHLNPGEQSFHYYIDKSDGKVHGFIAVGNINDRLPHIIISDNTNGKESALESAKASLELISNNLKVIETISAQIEDIIQKIEFADDFENFIHDFNLLSERVDKLENSEITSSEDIKLIQHFISANKEFIEENNTPITEVIENLVQEQLTGDIAEELKDVLQSDDDVKQIIKEIIEADNTWIDL